MSDSKDQGRTIGLAAWGLGGKAIEAALPGLRGRSSVLGFTLVELLVTLAVLAILLTIAVPSFNEVMLGGRLTSYANNLVGSAHLARSEAIKRNAVVTLCVSSDGTSCGAGNWAQGWIVVLADATVLQYQQALPAGLSVTSGVASIAFQPAVLGTTSTTLKVCRATPSAGAQERVVTIDATGRPTVKKTEDGSCP